ncbi:MAG: hypothetical protein R3F59_08645 [Myxococcota bacterium]
MGTELGAGVTVLAKDDGSWAANPSRIDGLTITGGDVGGGIYVNAFAHDLEIANNAVTGNAGNLHGGVRIGVPGLAAPNDGPFGYNTNVDIHHNAITLNGAASDTSAGGGLALCAGTDDYRVTENFVCGNFALGDGAGIAHYGLSDHGLIQHNRVLFNQTFNQGLTKSGGGILVSGEDLGGALTLGAGNVTVEGNLIQGNQAATGHGGGLRSQWFNGRDVELNPTQPSAWYRLVVENNVIVDNVAGWAGGGISLQDTVRGRIVLNTVANNDSTATVGDVFDAGTNTSTPQIAGIASERNSIPLEIVMPAPAPSRLFSNPTLTHNIIWHNRSFSYAATDTTAELLPALTPAAVGDCPAGADYWDVGVLDPTFALTPQFSILSEPAGPANSTADPEFLNAYCNGARELSTLGPMQVTPAPAEGGNFIDVRFGPITSQWPAGNAWDYHISETSPAIDWTPSNGQQRHQYIQMVLNEQPPPYTGVTEDVDGQDRTPLVDLGADEVGGAATLVGDCSPNSTNAGAACTLDNDCPPNFGPAGFRGFCQYP